MPATYLLIYYPGLKLLNFINKMGSNVTYWTYAQQSNTVALKYLISAALQSLGIHYN